MSQEEQIEQMRTWFFEHYDDPANLLPYESREGGYIPIYGPLEYTDEILYSQFGGEVDEDVIKELIDELDELNQWSPLPDDSWYPDEDYSDIVFYDTETIIENTFASLKNIEDQIAIAGQMGEYSEDFMRMLFARIYAIIESFLFDFFVNYSLENIEKTIPVLDKITHFKRHPISLQELNSLKDSEDIDKDIKKLMKERISFSALGFIWHRFDDVCKLYKKFGFEITTTELKQHLDIRNDIVHRDGRKKEDMSQKHFIEAVRLKELIIESRQIVETIKLCSVNTESNSDF